MKCDPFGELRLSDMYDTYSLLRFLIIVPTSAENIEPTES
jgi:hypothetical protein